MADIEKTVKTKEGKKHNYKCVGYHRGKPNNNKSTWSISIPEEVSCFKKSIESGWSDNQAWFGVYVPNGNKIGKLGINGYSEDLYIAKFVTDAKTYHGYPGDYIRNTTDIPSLSILEKWKDKGWISKSKMMKISRGMPCNL